MGIVAVCPNGHRIKVKDELAGRKGVCPTCAARFRIPHKDAQPDADSPRDVGTNLPTARAVSLDPVAVSTLPTAAPLDERPESPWLIAVRGGTPSGPLDAAAFGAWLESGEATAEHVVWREGWPEWRPLGDVCPGAIPPEPPAWP
jgi:hypothetical protein